MVSNIRDKRFPMQDGPSIDWQAADEIYEMYSELYGKSQSIERLAERGGFTWNEISHFTSAIKLKKIRDRYESETT